MKDDCGDSATLHALPVVYTFNIMHRHGNHLNEPAHTICVLFRFDAAC